MVSSIGSVQMDFCSLALGDVVVGELGASGFSGEVSASTTKVPTILVLRFCTVFLVAGGEAASTLIMSAGTNNEPTISVFRRCNGEDMVMKRCSKGIFNGGGGGNSKLVHE